ncbi:MAG: hypothetical protein NTW06_03565, partial [Candidatus Falkowbacteria bacterium]|nr:hypothetical protein [Candidatus Falkowbacteria bacterium]
MLGREKIKPASKQEKEGPIISGYYWENRDEPDYIPSSKALDVAAELAKVRRSLQETPDEEVLDGEESKKNISSQRREAEIDIDRRKVLTGFLG